MKVDKKKKKASKPPPPKKKPNKQKRPTESTRFPWLLASAYLHTCASRGIDFVFARTTKSNELMIFLISLL